MSSQMITYPIFHISGLSRKRGLSLWWFYTLQGSFPCPILILSHAYGITSTTGIAKIISLNQGYGTHEDMLQHVPKYNGIDIITRKPFSGTCRMFVAMPLYHVPTEYDANKISKSFTNQHAGRRYLANPIEVVVSRYSSRLSASFYRPKFRRIC